MNTATGSLIADVSGRAGELEQIVEGLWQKGYDLKKAGMGWVIREPLGSQKVELSSDRELIEFVSRGCKRDSQPVKIFPAPQTLPTLQIDKEASFTEIAESARQSSPVPAVHSSIKKENLLAKLDQRRLFLWTALLLFAVSFTVWYLVAGREAAPIGAEEVAYLERQQNDPGSSSQHSSDKDVDPALSYQRDSERPAALLTNAGRVSAPGKMSEPMIAVPEFSAMLHRQLDLSLFAEHCKGRLKERFGLGSLSLLINVQGRHAEACYVIDGLEHCPYVSRNQMTLNFVDDHSAASDVYACDIHLGKGMIGNFRRINANPDIVRFIIGETSGIK
jgi:hypothetical protein